MLCLLATISTTLAHWSLNPSFHPFSQPLTPLQMESQSASLSILLISNRRSRLNPAICSFAVALSNRTIGLLIFDPNAGRYSFVCSPKIQSRNSIPGFISSTFLNLSRTDSVASATRTSAPTINPTNSSKVLKASGGTFSP